MLTYNYKHELYHHGIQGMKWGKRNGPPYPLVPANYSYSEKKATALSGMGKAGAIGKNTAKGLNKAGNISNDINGVKERRVHREHFENSKKMSDADLQNKIKRMQLEQQYSRLASEESNIRAGENHVRNTLNTTANIAEIAGSAAVVAAAIYAIKKKV